MYIVHRLFLNCCHRLGRRVITKSWPIFWLESQTIFVRSISVFVFALVFVFWIEWQTIFVRSISPFHLIFSIFCSQTRVAA